jgi:hypothetical protein
MRKNPNNRTGGVGYRWRIRLGFSSRLRRISKGRDNAERLQAFKIARHFICFLI